MGCIGNGPYIGHSESVTDADDSPAGPGGVWQIVNMTISSGVYWSGWFILNDVVEVDDGSQALCVGHV